MSDDSHISNSVIGRANRFYLQGATDSGHALAIMIVSLMLFLIEEVLSRLKILDFILAKEASLLASRLGS
jgi:hypothetical protein